jgi:hypothetical protein
MAPQRETLHRARTVGRFLAGFERARHRSLSFLSYDGDSVLFVTLTVHGPTCDGPGDVSRFRSQHEDSPSTQDTLEAVFVRHMQEHARDIESPEYRLGEEWGELYDALFRHVTELEVRLRQDRLSRFAAQGQPFEHLVWSYTVRGHLDRILGSISVALARTDPDFVRIVQFYERLTPTAQEK